MAFRRKVEFKNHEPQFPAPLEGYAATVELPEGHHVTIGELTPGTIVEVATWNGTGKPDESTKRFLISADGTGLTRRVAPEQNQVAEKVQPEITNQIYVPDRWLNCIQKQLSHSMSLQLPGVDMTRVGYLEAQAEKAFMQASEEDRDKSPIYFQPNFSYYTR